MKNKIKTVEVVKNRKQLIRDLALIAYEQELPITITMKDPFKKDSIVSIYNGEGAFNSACDQWTKEEIQELAFIGIPLAVAVRTIDDDDFDPEGEGV